MSKVKTGYYWVSYVTVEGGWGSQQVSVHAPQDPQLFMANVNNEIGKQHVNEGFVVIAVSKIA